MSFKKQKISWISPVILKTNTNETKSAIKIHAKTYSGKYELLNELNELISYDNFVIFSISIIKNFSNFLKIFKKIRTNFLLNMNCKKSNDKALIGCNSKLTQFPLTLWIIFTTECHNQTDLRLHLTLFLLCRKEKRFFMNEFGNYFTHKKSSTAPMGD